MPHWGHQGAGGATAPAPGKPPPDHAGRELPSGRAMAEPGAATRPAESREGGTTMLSARMLRKFWRMGVLAVMCMLMLPLASPLAGAAPTQQRGAPFHLLEATVDGIHAAMRSGDLTCRQLVGLYLNRIEAYNREGPALNAIQTVNPRALDEAE